MVLPLLRRVITWDFGSGCMKTAVSAERMSAAASRARAARKRTVILIFIEGGGGEKLADFVVFSLVHMDIQLRGAVVGLGIDEMGALDLQLLALDDHAPHELAETRLREGLLERNIVALHDQVGRVHELVR